MKSAFRALEVLQLLTQSARPLSFSDCQQALAYPKASLHGLLRTMVLAAALGVPLLHPAELAWPEEDVIGAERVHRVFRGWLAGLGHDSYGSEVVSPGASTRSSD